MPFLHSDGASDTLSLHYLLTGKHLDYQKHVHLEFGGYVQTHEEHTNDMMPQMIGAICLGPSGNEQGGHYFISLMTGWCHLHDQWIELLMPHDAITHVGNLGCQQGMPKSLTFTDWYGFKIPDAVDAIDGNHNLDYDPADDNASTVSHTSSYSSHSNDSDDDDHSDWGNDFAQPLLGLTTEVGNNHNHEDDNSYHSDSNHSEHENEDHDDDNDADNNDEDDNDDDDDANDDNNNDDKQHTNDMTANDNQVPEINIPDTVISTPPASPSKGGGGAEIQEWVFGTQIYRIMMQPTLRTTVNRIS